MTIRNCEARGADTTAPVDGKSFDYGGFGVGGGLFATFVNRLELDQVTLDGNRAVGGNGKLMAGAALGGGMWLDNCNTTGLNITAVNNKVIGGSTAGPNRGIEGRDPEVFGGGIAVRSEPSNIGRSVAVFTNVTVSAPPAATRTPPWKFES